MTKIILNGHPTWAKLPRGKGKTIVLAHGGLSSSASLLGSIGPALSKHFAVAAFDRRGHGKTADTEERFSLDAMATEVIAFIEYLHRRVFLLGHSDGANVALLVALRRPDLLRRVVVVGANYHHDGLVPMEDFTPDSAGFVDFARDFALTSPDGLEHAAIVVQKTLRLVREEPTLERKDLAAITTPVLVMAGDDDVAQLSHTVSLYEALPEAQLAIVPGASHSVLKEHTKECVRLISRFLLKAVPPVTKYPLRRSRPDSAP